MSELQRAPGWPGIAPTWTSSAKDLVSTALGPSRIWVTLGYGIVNEIYWPSCGEPQVRDLGFIVAGEGKWSEVKRVARYTVSTPEPYVPLPSILHEGDGYRLELEVVPDRERDAVLIRYRLDGEDVKLYPLLAPHLGGSGLHNTAAAGDDLVAWKDRVALCLASDTGFARTSVGYVGVSDGWQDFSRNGAMSWTYTLAEDGNVAAMGELEAREGVLALAFANTIEGARTLAGASISEGIERARERFVSPWRAWGERLRIPQAPAAVRDLAYLSAAVVQVHEDQTYPGAIVASLSVPWGNTSDSSGGYHLVWTRDCVESSLAMLAVGQDASAQATLAYLIAIQRPDGSWSQNVYPDGRAYWTGVQLDEVAFPVLLAAKLREEGKLGSMHGVEGMVRRALAYIVANGPVSPQDRWEENAGLSPFTLAVVIAAAIGGSEFLARDERDYVRALADYWNERVEDWTFARSGALVDRFGVAGYYVRIGLSPLRCGLRGHVNVRNRGGITVAATELIGLEYLYLVRLGLRRADDVRIIDSLRISEAMLKAETPSGVAYYRYNQDGYGEHPDGSAFDGTGIGRLWPLLTGERAHYEIDRGRDPLPYLEMITRMTGPGGLLPEQIWDAAPIPEHGLFPGKPTGSAMPLVWAHAEFLKLVVARAEGRPVERLRAVEEHYASDRARSLAWYWRKGVPFAHLPAGRTLAIEAEQPFTLHFGFDGWRDVRDTPSEPLPFGRHAVNIAADALRDRGFIDFSMHFEEGDRWDGDHHVRLRASP